MLDNTGAANAETQNKLANETDTRRKIPVAAQMPIVAHETDNVSLKSQAQ